TRARWAAVRALYTRRRRIHIDLHGGARCRRPLRQLVIDLDEAPRRIEVVVPKVHEPTRARRPPALRPREARRLIDAFLDGGAVEPDAEIVVVVPRIVVPGEAVRRDRRQVVWHDVHRSAEPPTTRCCRIRLI